MQQSSFCSVKKSTRAARVSHQEYSMTDDAVPALTNESSWCDGVSLQFCLGVFDPALCSGTCSSHARGSFC